MDLVFDVRIDMDLVASAVVSLSGHCPLSIHASFCLDGERIYACLWRLMNPTGFQNALLKSMPSIELLYVLIEDWNTYLSEVIDEISP